MNPSILRRGLAASFVLFSALVLSIALSSPAAAGPYGDGVIAYEKGDFSTALQLLRPLADQGFAPAQSKLGDMYADGAGVPQDRAAAYMWFSLAAAQGFEEAQKARDIIVKLMTHGQIEEARLIAREWMAERRR